MPNGAKWFDNTLKAEGITEQQLIEFFEHHADIERWCFERETGENTGYEHYQIRYVLKKKSELRAEIIRWTDAFGADHSHISILGMQHPNWDYVQKDGNYIASWEYKSPIQKFKNYSLNTWQGQAIADLLEEQNDRQITVIVDETGGRGKTTLGKIAEANKWADYCPVLSEDAGEYIAYCFEYTASGYVFDLPRSDDIKKRRQLWRAIERIKDGCLYEKRYCPRKKWIDPPKILIFANEEPPYEALSNDRWRVFEITQYGKCPTLTPIKRTEYA